MTSMEWSASVVRSESESRSCPGVWHLSNGNWLGVEHRLILRELFVSSPNSGNVNNLYRTSVLSYSNGDPYPLLFPKSGANLFPWLVLTDWGWAEDWWVIISSSLSRMISLSIHLGSTLFRIVEIAFVLSMESSAMPCWMISRLYTSCG